MLTVGGIKINFYRYIGVNAMCMILFNRAGISLTVWEGIIFPLAILFISVEELEE